MSSVNSSNVKFLAGSKFFSIIRDLNLLFLDHDKKRLVYKLEMRHKGEDYLAATTEVCSLYVDLSVRRVIEFEMEKSSLIDKFINENKKDFNPGESHLINKLKK